jgi:O-antigen ligase
MFGMLGDPNDMGAVIAMSLPFALVPVFEESTGPLSKAAGLLYTGLAAVAIWLTRSRGAMLAVAAEFLAVRLVRSKKKNRLGLILTAGLLGAGYFGLMSLVPRSADDLEASEGSRLTFWKSAVNMAVKNPVLGVGYNQYPSNYMSYAVGTIYERGRRTAHSSWFLALGESGFVGFFLFCAFFISVVRIAWRNRARRPAQFYAVAGYGVAMSFLSHTYSLYFYILMALILASAGVKERISDGA